MNSRRFLILIFLIFLSACSWSKPLKYESPVPGQPSEVPNFLPHPAGWADATSHGLFASDYGISNCQGFCHGEAMKGGSAVGCDKCHHKNWAEKAGLTWADASQHGAKATASIRSCKLCHGQDLDGGVVGKKCSECHTDGVYPHGADWMAKHKDTAARSLDSCVKCHIAPDRNDCSSCHHKQISDWVNLHAGHAALDIEKCKICHGGDLLSGTGVAAGCKRCHHDTVSIADHKVTGAMPADGCRICHGEDLKGGISGKSCYSCHSGVFPHMKGDKSWVDMGHVSAAGDSFEKCVSCHISETKNDCKKCHHDTTLGWLSSDGGIHADKASTGLDKCQKCHGADLKSGSLIAEGCVKCHHKNWSDSHVKLFADSSQHGPKGRSPATACKICHGVDLLNGDGGVVGVKCSSPCHKNVYPHTADWSEAALHGTVAKSDISKCTGCHVKESTNDCKKCHHENVSDWTEIHDEKAKESIDACKVCHGDKLDGSVMKGACKGCHHDNWAETHEGREWREMTEHGVRGKKPATGCKVCHRDDLLGTPVVYGCKNGDCHGGQYPHDDGWFAETGGGSHTSVTKEQLAICAKCHVEGTAVRCKSCHHDNVSDWGDDHGDKAKVSIDSCKICHGTNLKSGSAIAKGCDECHHEKWKDSHDGRLWGTITEHGSRGKKPATGCKICHGENLDGGPVEKSCFECHDGKYPHADGWFAEVTGGSHIDVTNDQLVICAKCHVEGTAVRCDSCHGHEDENWKSVVHKNIVNVDKCIACHSADLKSPTPIVSEGCNGSGCHHNDWEDSHAGKFWAEKTEHGASANSSDDGCKKCHGSDLGGGSVGVACGGDIECHHGITLPHPADTWVADDGGLHAVKASGEMSQCKGCHIDGTSGNNCKTCHHDNVTGWIDDHDDEAAVSLTGCKRCHGADLVSGTAFARGCEAGEVCHGTSLHGTGFRTSHKELVPTEIEKCKICHGSDLKGGIAVGCYSCHDIMFVYPHDDPNWNTGAGHGSLYYSNRSSAPRLCKNACHGVDLLGGISNKPCNQSTCHSEYPHPNYEIWFNDHPDSVLRSSTEGEYLDLTIYNAKCACHGRREPSDPFSYLTENWPPMEEPEDSSGRPRVFRCNLCHPLYPHIGLRDSESGSTIPWTVEGGHPGGHGMLLLTSTYFGASGLPEHQIASRISTVSYAGFTTSCVGDDRCHKNSRKGEYLTDLGLQPSCTGNLCHQAPPPPPPPPPPPVITLPPASGDRRPRGSSTPAIPWLP